MKNVVRIAGLVNDSIVDGPGLRFTIFTQGCPHHCKGCHNPKTHDFNGGKVVRVNEILEEINKARGTTGITLSGGEPFSQAEALAPLAKFLKKMGYEVASYSGWTFEELNSGKIPFAKELLENIDILIDGKFILEQRSLELSFRGSKNQRIIDVPKSLKCGYAVETDRIDWLGKEFASNEPDEFAPKDIRSMGK